MQPILVHIATSDGKIRRSSLEALSRAREIARRLGAGLDAVVLDPDPAHYRERVAAYGVDRLFAVSSTLFAEPLNPAVVRGLEQAILATDAQLVVFASTEAVKDIIGALAIRVGGAAIPDVAEFDFDGKKVSALRPVMAAKKLARTESDSRRILVSVRSGSYSGSADPGETKLEELQLDFDLASQTQTLREVVTTVGGEIDLAEAAVVVSAGRGVRDENGRRLVEQLARELGAGIGATRAVVESGLYPATAQIGQTGKVVAPQLYFAIGISGAIQHVAGMANSNVIVAINKDPDAPIFDVATYGVVGDLFKVLPALVERIRQAKDSGAG